MNFDFITTVLLSLVTAWLFISNVLKTKRLNTAEVFSHIFFIATIFIISIEFVFYSHGLSFYKFLEYRSMALIFMHATVLGTIGLLAIDELDPKKVKTIWRLPVLGLLLSFFAINFHLYIQLAIGVITFLIFLKNRNSLRFIKRILIVHTLCVAAFAAAGDFQFWLFNIILIIYIINLKEIWDMLRLKQSCSEDTE